MNGEKFSKISRSTLTSLSKYQTLIVVSKLVTKVDEVEGNLMLNGWSTRPSNGTKGGESTEGDLRESRYVEILAQWYPTGFLLASHPRSACSTPVGIVWEPFGPCPHGRWALDRRWSRRSTRRIGPRSRSARITL